MNDPRLQAFAKKIQELTTIIAILLLKGRESVEIETPDAETGAPVKHMVDYIQIEKDDEGFMALFPAEDIQMFANNPMIMRSGPASHPDAPKDAPRAHMVKFEKAPVAPLIHAPNGAGAFGPSFPVLDGFMKRLK
jgi:hypothetical protein